MDINKEIKKIIKEADLYQTQGLLSEAESKYQEILKLFQGNLEIENADRIKKAVEKKISDLDKERKHVEKKVMSPHMTKESQDLITQMFVDADGEDSSSAKFEGAKALIKFGQFDRAVEELKHLIKEDEIKSDAAKQLITCYILSLRVDEGIKQIENWISSEFLSKEQLENLLKHARELFKTRGIERDLPEIPKKVIPEPAALAKAPEPAASAKAPEPAAPAKAPEPQQVPEPAPAAKTPEPKAEPVAKKEEASDNNLAYKKDSFFFEEDFEEYDILASVKKADKKKQ